MDIRRDDHSAASYFGPDNFGRQVLSARDEMHLLGDDALARIMQLRADCIVLPFLHPFGSHETPTFRDIVTHWRLGSARFGRICQ